MLNAVLPFAKEMLGQHGEFFPYGITLRPDGSVKLVAGDPGTGEHPDPNDVLDVLYSTLWAQSEGLVATAVVSDVRLVHPPTAAIRVELEHGEGTAITVLLHYEVATDPSGVGSALVMGAVQAVLGEPRTWPIVD